MDPQLFFRFFILILLLCLSALFSGAEVAFFSLSPVQVDMLRDKRGTSGRIVSRLLESPRRLLVTIYLANEFVNVAIAAVSTMLSLHFFGDYGVAASVGIGTFILLVFGEITPKSFAFRHAQSYALIIARPLMWFSRIIYPVQSVITFVTNKLLAVTGAPSAGAETQITEDEMKTVLEHGAEEGVIKSDEKEMILNVFELGDTQVNEIMTPRTEMFALPIEKGFDVIARRAALSNYSRIPIYRSEPDSIEGILYTKDLLDADGERKTGNLDKILRKPYFIPETKKIDELLREFRKKHTHLAIVMDEYGGVQGLVTLDDILEEIVGEEGGKKDISKISPVASGCYHVSGRLALEEFNRFFNSGFDVEDVDTVGGLVFHLFGRMPREGESVSDGGFKFTIRKMKGAKIQQLSVKIPAPRPAEQKGN
jgi:CBS domain containing-hemolysin-like protein